MRFDNMNDAKIYASIQSIITGRKHKAVKSRYFSVNMFDYVNSFTVVLSK